MVFEIYNYSGFTNNGKIPFYMSTMVCSWKRGCKSSLLLSYLEFCSWFFFENRLNVFYQALVKLKNVNFLIYYPNKPIIVYLMVIIGFLSFVVHHQINLHVCNDVNVVLFPCFWISCIMIYPMKLKWRIQQILVVYLWVHLTSLLNR